jgi:dolichol-phosphate mannosyltransferase
MKDFIIIPTYNEKENISRLIHSIYSIIPHISIMVVDDNSPDGTAMIVQNLKSLYPNLSLLLRGKKSGIGMAYINGFRIVLKDNEVNRILTMDADLSHDPNYLLKMIKESQAFDVVIGSRYVKGGSNRKMNFLRRSLSYLGNLYFRIITGIPVRDCTAGFMVIRGDLLRSSDLSRLPQSGFAFLMELKYLLWKKGASFKEVPIEFMNRAGGKSKISLYMILEAILSPWRMVSKRDRSKWP